jgi:hypothetical protein
MKSFTFFLAGALVWISVISPLVLTVRADKVQVSSFGGEVKVSRFSGEKG